MRRSIDEVLAERVKTYRTEQKLRQEDLAGRTRALGHPVSRLAIVKIESGGTRASNVSLQDWLALAAALDVPPPLLFLPLGDDDTVEVLPGLEEHPQLVLDWFTGDYAPRKFDEDRWFRNTQPLRLFEGLRERQDAVHNAQAALSAEWQQRIDRTAPDAREQAKAAVAAVLAFDGPDEDFARVDRAVSEVAGWVEAMRAAGVRSVPELPKAWQARMAKLAAED